MNAEPESNKEKDLSVLWLECIYFELAPKSNKHHGDISEAAIKMRRNKLKKKLINQQVDTKAYTNMFLYLCYNNPKKIEKLTETLKFYTVKALNKKNLTFITGEQLLDAMGITHCFTNDLHIKTYGPELNINMVAMLRKWITTPKYTRECDYCGIIMLKAHYRDRTVCSRTCATRRSELNTTTAKFFKPTRKK